MAFPRILFAAPLLVAGIVVPAAGVAPLTPPRGAISMEHEMFTQQSVTIHPGQTLTMVNNSQFVHIIGPGRDGKLYPEKGVPIDSRHLMQTNDVYTTPPWNIPGTFYVTCSVHPEMTVKVIVTQ